MRYPFHALLGMALIAAPAATYAQGPAGGANPAARLLSHRAELSLTDAQVIRLEALDRRVAQQDAELRTQLEALRGRPLGEPLLMRRLTAEERARIEAERAAMQPLARQLREMHAQAAAEARDILTAEQQNRADAFLFRGPGAGLGRGPAAGPAGRPGRGAGRGAGRGWRAGGGAGADPAGPGLRQRWRQGWQ